MNSLEKTPCFEIKLKLNKFPKDLRKTFLNQVSVFTWATALLRSAPERRIQTSVDNCRS
jgi:hypothetical protein